MAFVKVKYLLPPDRWEDTVIINTDKIHYIVKSKGEVVVGIGESYYVSYEGANGHDDPRFFDRENAEKIFKAIGMSLD